MCQFKIVKPEDAPKSYDVAVRAFAELSQAITGREAEICTADDGRSDTVIIGGEEVNRLAFDMRLEGSIPAFDVAYGTDEYRILSAERAGRRFLLLVGGCGRSTIYAVYDYFERIMGCRYFWDSDIIPPAEELVLQGVDIREKPHFQYRGLRYFAHRALHRFQAEHWSFEDWQREIDWLLKKRLNLFMLRIGNDDVFQKAFPDIVPYPSNCEKLNPEKTGYDDRTTAWSLQYRGELRRQILAYAFERELLHPEDCGTMTHWYTPTPKPFIEAVKPTVFPQANDQYDRDVCSVWDIREKENFDNYFALTEAHIKAYGRPDLFHTIGLAERNVFAEHDRDIFLKKYVYKRILAYLKEHYPRSPVLIASWDLWMHFTKEDIRQLVRELDPEQAIIFDYTSDTDSENNFTRWGVVGQFPYIFGMFLGYSRNSDIRNNYALTEARLQIAAHDPYCRGLVLWPELSHSSTFMTEYLASNAWAPLTMSMDERIEKYCADRYVYQTDVLVEVWKKFFPISELMTWSMGKEGAAPIFNTRELFFLPFDAIREIKNGIDSSHGFSIEQAEHLRCDAREILLTLASLSEEALNNGMICRDVFDIARTVLGRYIFAEMLRAIASFEKWRKTHIADAVWEHAWKKSIRLLSLLGDLLGEHLDYSMYESYKRLQAVSEVNPTFEDSLKQNASCDYHRSYVYESVKALYLPEMQMVYDWMKACIAQAAYDTLADEAPYYERKKENTEQYFVTPLSVIGSHEHKDVREILRAAASVL